MKYQVKVSTTQKYSDSQGEHIVCEGKLVLIEDKSIKENQAHTLWKNKNGQLLLTHTSNSNHLVALKPIIISETEEIEVGDWVYNSNTNTVFKATQKFISTISNFENHCYFKILALSEHFSPKHLQAIVDGKLKDGDKVLVKCRPEPKLDKDSFDKGDLKLNKDGYKIYLNQQNHITLFSAKQSLYNASLNYIKCTNVGESLETDYRNEALINAFITGAEWAKKNNY